MFKDHIGGRKLRSQKEAVMITGTPKPCFHYTDIGDGFRIPNLLLIRLRCCRRISLKSFRHTSKNYVMKSSNSLSDSFDRSWRTAVMSGDIFDELP